MKLIMGLGHAPEFFAHITTLAESTTQYNDAPLASYGAYDPCRFLVLNRVISAAVGINDTAGEEQHVWPVDDPISAGDPKVGPRRTTRGPALQ